MTNYNSISHYYGFISEGDLRHYTVKYRYSAFRPVPGLLIYVINIYPDSNYHIMNLDLKILKNKKIQKLKNIRQISLARSCNVATDRLEYQDARGLSAGETWPGFRIGGCTMPRDAELIFEVGPVGS